MTDHEIVMAMWNYGGSFTQALAQACLRADPENLARIKAAFRELWDEYAEIAAGMKARREADAAQG